MSTTASTPTSAPTSIRPAPQLRRHPDVRRAHSGAGDGLEGGRAASENADELLDELRAWLESAWDPDLTVGAWWERLGSAGWSAPSLPPNAFGKGCPGTTPFASPRPSPTSAHLVPPRGSGCCSPRRPSPLTARRSRSIASSATSSAAGALGASCSASRPPARTWPACRPGPSVTETFGWSTVRRCGRRAHRSRTSGCCLPYRPRRSQAPGNHLLRFRDGPAGVESVPSAR